MADIRDLNDGKAWSEMDLRELSVAIQFGNTIEDAAMFLCRKGTVEEVEAKVRELGLEVRHD